MHQQGPSSPRLDALLARLRQNLARQIWLHGTGTVVAVAAGWLVFAFLADWLLHVPTAVRVFHGLVLVGLPVFFFGRHLVAHLKRLPDRAGLALMIERRHPESAEVFVSAVQLAPMAERSPARGLIENVVREAEGSTDRVDLTRVLDRRGPRRRVGLGVGTAAIAAAVLLASPQLTRIFFQRMVGMDVAWPQRTHLAVEIPVVGERAHVVIGDEEILVRTARGSDIPVLVRADGVVPREVTLHFSSGHKSMLGSGGTPLFKTLLRSVQEDLEFYVTGGDDDDGLPIVRLTVLQPPDVAGLAFRVEPPAYSGIAPSLVFDSNVEVLEGSTVTVHMLPDPLEAEGIARTLPDDRELTLQRAPFPRDVERDGPSTEPVPVGLAFTLSAEKSLRFRFALTDASGLANPDPGLFGVQVIEDHRPEVLLLAPGRAEVDVVAGGAVPLRVRVEDDFGVASLAWDARSPQAPDEVLSGAELELLDAGAPEGPYGTGPRVVSAARTRLEVDALGGDEILLEGQQIVVQVVATDNREPDPNVSQSTPVRLRLVSGDDFLRRLQDSLARAGESASRLAELTRLKRGDTRQRLAALSSDEPEATDLGSLVNGVRRVQGDSRALARDLSAVAESLLYSRVDPRGGSLLEAIDTKLAEHMDRSFHPEPWLWLSEQYAAGQLGQADLAGDLVEIVGLSLAISETHAAAAVAALEEAQSAASVDGARAALTRADEAQNEAQDAIERLLVKLGEWDNFQSVLTLTRDILNRQKNLKQRTEKHAEDH